MAEVWVSAAGAVVAAGGAAYSAHQQGKAADQAAAGAAAARALTEAQYEQMRTDLRPYMLAGERAINQMQALNRGDFSGFYESPDYKFIREQGIKGLDRSAAARGTLYSGGQLAALANYAGGIASQSYGDYYNRLAELAGLGQNAAAGAGNAGMGFAAQAGDALMSQANALAAGRIGQASTYANLGEQLSNAFGRWYENRRTQQS